MADWVDKELGEFCKGIQDQIDDLPFLDPITRKKFTDMLEECAQKAHNSETASVKVMRRELNSLKAQFKIKTGKDLIVA